MSNRFLRRRRSSSMPDIGKETTTKVERRGDRFQRNTPIPYRSIAEPTGQDLDFVTVAHSHLVRGEWPRMVAISAGLSPFRVKHILLKVQKDPVLSFEFYEWTLRQNPHLQTLENQAVILHILTRSRRFRPAESILRKNVIRKMAGCSQELFDSILYSYRLCNSSPNVFDCLFKTYAHMSKFRDATETFRRMRDFGFLPSIKSCNAFLSSLLDSNRTDIILTFYCEMRRCGISPNSYTLNMVMCALCNSQKLDKAMDLFEEMEKKGLTPVVSTFNTLIDGHCKKGLLESAINLMATMSSQGLRPNAVTYNTIIHGFCKQGRLEDANKIFNRMKADQVNPNIVTYNTLIHGYSQTGGSEMSLRLHEEMIGEGIQADIFTYNALILGLCNEGKTKKAENLVKELKRENLSPNASTFSALIAGQCRRQNSERAFDIYREMKRCGHQLNRETFHLLISTYCKNHDFEGAVEALREMLQTSIQPQESLLVELVEGLRRSGKALGVLSEIDLQNPILENLLKDLTVS